MTRDDGSHDPLAPEWPRVRPGDSGDAVVDPSSAGWRYLAFGLHRLSSNALAPLYIGRPGHETAIVTLTGGTIMTFDAAPPVRLPGRASVFEGLPWAAYLPAGRTAALEPVGELAEVAVIEAPTSGRPSVRTELGVIGPDDVRIELRGAAGGSCQVNEILGPDFRADRLMLFEILVPAGNWSSWPPPRRDGGDATAEALDEVDHFRFRRPEGWGVQRLYGGGGSPDALLVTSGDSVIVPGGHHTFAAAPGVDAYYLRALAGDARAAASFEVPDLAVEPAASTEMAADPRLPLVGR